MKKIKNMKNRFLTTSPLTSIPSNLFFRSMKTNTLYLKKKIEPSEDGILTLMHRPSPQAVNIENYTPQAQQYLELLANTIKIPIIKSDHPAITDAINHLNTLFIQNPNLPLDIIQENLKQIITNKPLHEVVAQLQLKEGASVDNWNLLALVFSNIHKEEFMQIIKTIAAGEQLSNLATNGVMGLLFLAALGMDINVFTQYGSCSILINLVRDTLRIIDFQGFYHLLESIKIKGLESFNIDQETLLANIIQTNNANNLASDLRIVESTANAESNILRRFALNRSAILSITFMAASFLLNNTSTFGPLMRIIQNLFGGGSLLLPPSMLSPISIASRTLSGGGTGLQEPQNFKDLLNHIYYLVSEYIKKKNE
jgi:hypothetical protein